ncbi:MAG: energy transducer TonB [Acidobacteria bacterium]|nr:energy transducer TonB [Acidobacteriota bacterium]
MFDRLVVSSGRAARHRSSTSLGVALLTHASFVGALLLVPLLCPEMVMPDPGDVLAFVGPPVVVPPPLPPRAGRGGSPPETAGPPARPAMAVKPGAVYAPWEISDHIPPPAEPFLLMDPAAVTDGASWGPPGETGIPGTIGVPAEAMDLYAGGRPEVAPPPLPPAAPAPVRVKATVLSARLIHRVEPEYPLAARLARKEDTVILQVRVDESGRVSEVTVISGNVLFRQAAVAAVRQWVYTPLLINGMPRPVMGTVVLRFILR